MNMHRGSNGGLRGAGVRCAWTAALVCMLALPSGAGATLLTTPLPAGIPTGAAVADDLVVDFQFLFARPLPANGIFSFTLTTSGVDAGESIVVDMFGDTNGARFLGTAYSGPFVELSGNCRVGSALCNELLDGQFSVGLRMTGGAAMLTSYTVNAWVPKEPAALVAAQVASAPEPGTLPLAAAAMVLAAFGLRRSVSARPRTTSR